MKMWPHFFEKSIFYYNFVAVNWGMKATGGIPHGRLFKNRSHNGLNPKDISFFHTSPSLCCGEPLRLYIKKNNINDK